jgi:WD40-like Beta Propeller Repeat
MARGSILVSMCALLAAAGTAVLTGAVAIASANTVQPRVFAPGIISGPASDAAATFSPDGKTVYFTRSNGEDYDIMSSHLDGAGWSQPTIAPFSGHWRDLEPAMAPDGSYLIFASSRPIDAGGKALDGHWGGQAYPGRGGHLWRVSRQGDGWGAPVLLPETVNRFDSTFSPAIAADGSLYFMAATGPGGHFQLYCSQFRHGRYRTPELLPFSAGQYGGVDPAVAPDQSFIVFASNRPPAPAHQSYVFIAFRTGGRWGEPIPLPPSVNGLGHSIELRLGPDGHTLYLTSDHVVPPDYPKTHPSSLTGLQQMQSWNDGEDNIWVVDLAPWLERARRGDR